ncbi:MAG: hypothetical protein V1793_07175 [Pseudomonadota bacterium]
MNTTISAKVKHWIENGKDPRSALWQGGLEEVLDLFFPHLEPGRLICAHPLDDADQIVFQAVLEAVDLSPGIVAVVLPPAVAGPITPPEAARELVRIDGDKPSWKLLIARPGDELRILCAEVSEQAARPGADIFQAGALLGSYNYASRAECLADLPKVIRAHLWEKGRWSQEKHRQYTLDWFDRAMELGRGSIPVEKNASFLHSPTLIKGNRVNAVFTLIGEVLEKRVALLEETARGIKAALGAQKDPDAVQMQLSGLVERAILDLLNFMKTWDLVPFGEFSNAETEQFKREFSRIQRRLLERLIHPKDVV